MRLVDGRLWHVSAVRGIAASAVIAAFAERELWNIGRKAIQSHCALMLAARITLLHFSVSLAINLPNSAGVAMNGVASASASRALIFGSARPALISLLSLS